MKMEQFKNDCSPILPDALYVSGYSVASDLDLLNSHGITHIGIILFSLYINIYKATKVKRSYLN